MPHTLVNLPQIKTRDPRTCTIFIPAWGSNLGYLVFPAIKITVIRQVRMYCGLSVNDKHARNAARREKIVDAFCLHLFLTVWLAKIQYPNCSAMADNTITRGGIGVLVSPFYICGPYTCLLRHQSAIASTL